MNLIKVVSKGLPLVVLLAFSAGIAAQPVSMEAVLASARTDARVLAAADMPIFTQSLNYRLPLLRKVELRLGLNGNLFRDTLYGDIRNEDFYGLYIYPNSLRERRLQRDIQPAQASVYEAGSRIAWQQAVLERYQALTQLYFSGRLLEARASLDSLLSVKQRLMLQMLDQGVEIKVKEVVDTENDRSALQFGMSEAKNDIRLQTAKIRSFVQPDATAEAVHFDSFITTDVIASVLAKMPEELPSMEYRISKIRLAQAGLALENVQNKQILSFIQLGYELPIVTEPLPKRLNPANNFSVRIGLALPLPGNNNLKRANAALELREAQNELKTTEQQTRKSIESQRIRVENLIALYRNLRDQTAESLIGKLLDADNSQVQLTPLELVELYVSRYKRDLRALETESEIADEYLKYLETSGKLGALPARNYLSNTLGEF